MNQHELSWAVQYKITYICSQSLNNCFAPKEYACIFPDLRAHFENTVCSPKLQKHLDAVKRHVVELERTEKDPYVELDLEGGQAWVSPLMDL
jgi:hypothetical protein